MNKSPYRIVNFPDNICLCEVQFLQRQDSSSDEENNVFGNAQGSIRVRENETLKLTVWEKESLPHLSKLRPDDLQPALLRLHESGRCDHVLHTFETINGKVRFVLGGSGHIAGIVNPPSANKYGYWTNEKPADAPQAWLDAAKQHAGSWWSDWAKWVEHYAGDKVAARVPGDGKLEALEDAPGSFVKLRLDTKHAG